MQKYFLLSLVLAGSFAGTAAFGSFDFLRALPAVPDREAAVKPELVHFSSDIEPLVRLTQFTAETLHLGLELLGVLLLLAHLRRPSRLLLGRLDHPGTQGQVGANLALCGGHRPIVAEG